MSKESPASATLAGAKRLLARVLGEFSGYSEMAPAAATMRSRVSDSFPVPGLARVAFAVADVGVLLPAQDKERWRIGFGFRGQPCAMIHSKHGVWIEGADDALVTEISLALRKAVRIVEVRLLRLFADRQLTEGDVTAANDYSRIRGMYSYFRRTTDGLLAEQLVPLPPANPPTIVAPDEILADVSDFVGAIIETQGRRTQAQYNQVAAVIAYFSLLEHVLFLLTAFLPPTSEQVDVRVAIGRSWSDKWKFVFPLTDAASKAHYDALHRIAETQRNFYSHGGLGRDGTTLYFHVPAVGALPVTMSSFGGQRTFNLWVPAPQAKSDEIADLWVAFDGIDAFLAHGTMRHAMTYIAAGLDVRFDAEWRSEFTAASGSDEAFDAWVRIQSTATAHFDNFE